MTDTTTVETDIIRRFGIGYRELALHLVYQPETGEAAFCATYNLDTRIPVSDRQAGVILDALRDVLEETDIEELMA